MAKKDGVSHGETERLAAVGGLDLAELRPTLARIARLAQAYAKSPNCDVVLLEGELNLIAGIPQIRFQGLVALDFQLEVHPAPEIEAQADLGGGNEEERADATNDQRYDEAPNAPLAHGVLQQRRRGEPPRAGPEVMLLSSARGRFRQPGPRPPGGGP